MGTDDEQLRYFYRRDQAARVGAEVHLMVLKGREIKQLVEERLRMRD